MLKHAGRWTAVLAFAGASLHAQAAPQTETAQRMDVPPRGNVAPALDDRRLFTNIAVLAADSMEGRMAGSRGGEKARAFLIREFKRIGLQPLVKGYAMPFAAHSRFPERSQPASRPDDDRPSGSFGRRPIAPSLSRPARSYPLVTGANLLGVVRGTLHPERFIVVSAHYDHLGMREGTIFHGADDNASGSAAILSIAEWTVQHPPLNSVIFAWFDAEEEGLLGSTEFVDHPPVALDRIVADLNLDMVSRSTVGAVNIVGAQAYPIMQPFIDSVAALGFVKVHQGHEGITEESRQDNLTDRSDQGPFNHKRIPWVLFSNDEHADYHQPTDEAIRINPAFFYGCARSAAAFLEMLDASLDRVAAVRQGTGSR